MAIIGGNYESLPGDCAQSGANRSDDTPAVKTCEYYGCELLRAKTVYCIETMHGQTLHGHDVPFQVLLRRSQTMLLLQIVSMCSEVERHRMSAKLSHGTLLAIARELLQRVSFEDHNHSWAAWIRREEIIRTMWSVYLIDCLQSFCYRRRPGLDPAELSHLPDVGPDELWQARNEADFNELAAQHAVSRVSFFDYILSLKDAEIPTLSGRLSLPGQLFVVATLVTEIMSTAQSDLVKRQQLATRLRSIMSMPPSSRNDALRTLSQAVDRTDLQLRQQVESESSHLMRWLSMLHHSARSSRPQIDTKRPFFCDFMPWYWAGLHLLGTLRERLNAGGGDPGRFRERVAPYYVAPKTETNDSDDNFDRIMHLLVRIRLSLGILDGGAKMHSVLGSEHFDAALPVLPEYLSKFSFWALFPPWDNIDSQIV